MLWKKHEGQGDKEGPISKLDDQVCRLRKLLHDVFHPRSALLLPIHLQIEFTITSVCLVEPVFLRKPGNVGQQICPRKMPLVDFSRRFIVHVISHPRVR